MEIFRIQASNYSALRHQAWLTPHLDREPTPRQPAIDCTLYGIHCGPNCLKEIPKSKQSPALQVTSRSRDNSVLHPLGQKYIEQRPQDVGREDRWHCHRKEHTKRINAEIKKTQETNPRYKPSLTIVQVGDRSGSSTYVRMKLKAAEEANIICNLVHYPESITEAELLQHITQFNNDPTIHGILVQLPVPKHISEHAITSAVAEEKDVDGFGAGNIGELSNVADILC